MTKKRSRAPSSLGGGKEKRVSLTGGEEKEEFHPNIDSGKKGGHVHRERGEEKKSSNSGEKKSPR